jgi:hypothetical protein
MLKLKRKTKKTDYELIFNILYRGSKDSEFELYVKYMPRIQKMCYSIFNLEDRDTFFENSYFIHLKALQSLRNYKKSFPENYCYYGRLNGYLGAERNRIANLRKKDENLIIDIHYGSADDNQKSRIYLDNFNEPQSYKADRINYERGLVEYQFEKQEIIKYLHKIKEEQFNELEEKVFNLKLEQKPLKVISEKLGIPMPKVRHIQNSIRIKLQGTKLHQMFKEFNKRIFI